MHDVILHPLAFPMFFYLLIIFVEEIKTFQQDLRKRKVPWIKINIYSHYHILYVHKIITGIFMHTQWLSIEKQ